LTIAKGALTADAATAAAPSPMFIINDLLSITPNLKVKVGFLKKPYKAD
jgi:hypothetical protein